MSLPQLAQDKANHFIYGMAIFVVVFAVLGGAVGIAAGLAVSTAFAIGKELYYDKYLGKGTPDKYDAIVTITGGVAGAVTALLAIFR